jgi:hypothetical protein
VFNSSTSAIQSFPKVEEESVNTMAPDGSGGFYIGGNFTHVGGVPRNNLARVLANGTVDPNWDPSADGMVTKIVFGNSAVYVAGGFTNIGSQTRPGLAKLNPTTGAVDTNFNANASGTFILALAVDSTDLYVGGMFMSIDSQSRQNLARLNANTGAADTWDPSVTGAIVKDIVLTTSDVYIGGSFYSGWNDILQMGLLKFLRQVIALFLLHQWLVVLLMTSNCKALLSMLGEISQISLHQELNMRWL